jgi:hypothetical protein
MPQAASAICSPVREEEVWRLVTNGFSWRWIKLALDHDGRMRKGIVVT